MHSVIQIWLALRFLGLVDSNGIPANRLKQLVSAKDIQRTEILRQVASEAFDFLLHGSLDSQTATYAQIEELFHNTYQLTPDVSRKCIKFFVGLSHDAEIPLSPFIIKKAKVKTAGAGIRKISPKVDLGTKTDSTVPQNIPDQWSLDKILLSKFPTFDPSWTDEVKIKWFDAFDTLLRRISVRYGEKANGT